MHAPPESPVVGIFGTGRNGSTLLMRLLDGSPDLWIYPVEVNWFAVRHVPYDEWAQRELVELRESYVDRLAAPVDAEVETPSPAGDPEHDVLAYLDATRRAYAPDDRRRIPTFKSLEVTELARYEQAFPGLRFVHIVRDPRTTYASLKRSDMIMKRRPFWSQGDLLDTLLERRWIPHAKFLLGHPGERHHWVRYEDLCADPERVITEICAWLGVAPPPEPSVQTVLGGRRAREFPVNPSQVGVTTPERVVGNMAQRYGYEEVVTERERAFIDFRTAALAEQFGYADRDASRISLAGHWLLPDRWEWMNIPSRRAFAVRLLRRRAYIYGKLLGGER
jgi:hypothetical protein